MSWIIFKNFHYILKDQLANLLNLMTLGATYECV